MSDSLQKDIRAIERRVNRLENLAWVIAAVALFLGLGGGSLWSKLNSANIRADVIAQSFENISSRIDKEIIDKVTVAATELDAKSAEIQAEIKKLRGADPGWGVAYCTHQESNGWFGWVVDGQQSGKSGISKRLEAIKITLYRKDQPAPSGKCS